MSCAEFDTWTPIPPGSRFCAKVTATNMDFLATVRIATSDGTVAVFGTTALLNGPACIPLEQRGYGVGATVFIDDEAPMVVLDLMVLDANDKVVNSSQCQFSKAKTEFVVTRLLVP
jgi:hypothetical protein